jgi:hypothetical protein
MWSDYGAPRRKHWRGRSRRSSRSSIGPWILAAAVVVVAGVIGISGMYPQIIDPEWVRGTSPHSQRVSETAPESVGMTHPDPFASPPGAIAAIASLGDDPLKPHDTYLSEDDRAVRIRDVLRQAEAVLATIQKLGQ